MLPGNRLIPESTLPVTRKTQLLTRNAPGRIDGEPGWRYSLPQIPDLVNLAIPRLRSRGQSYGSALRIARRSPSKIKTARARVLHVSYRASVTKLCCACDDAMASNFSSGLPALNFRSTSFVLHSNALPGVADRVRRRLNVPTQRRTGGH